MKRAHRRSHMIMWAVLVPVTLIAFFFALQDRQPEPLTDEDLLTTITGRDG